MDSVEYDNWETCMSQYGCREDKECGPKCVIRHGEDASALPTVLTLETESGHIDCVHKVHCPHIGHCTHVGKCLDDMKRFLVDPPGGVGRKEFDTEVEAEQYADDCPAHTRIVDREGDMGPISIGLSAKIEPPCGGMIPSKWSAADPSYYRGERDPSYDLIDVIFNFNLDFDLGCVVKYVCRAGKKPGNDFLKDLRKAKRVLERRIAHEEGKTATCTSQAS